MGNFQDKAFRLNAYISTIGNIKNRWELETLAWQWKVKTTYISIFLWPYRQPWKSHQPCASDAFPNRTLPTILDITWLEYRFQGNAINLPCTYCKTQAHKPAEKTIQKVAFRGCVGWRFYYPNSTSRHSQARGAIPTWNPTSNFLASSDDCMTQRLVQSIFPPQRFMLIQFGWIRVLWTGWVLSRLNERQSWRTVLATRVVSCKCIQKESHITDCTLPNQTMKMKLLSIPIKANLVENWNLQTPWMLEGSVRELRMLITYIPKPGYVSWSCQPLGLEKRERLPSIWPYTALQQRWAPWHDMPGSSTWAAIVTPCFSIASIFAGFFFANILTCQGKTAFFCKMHYSPRSPIFAKAIQRGPISLHAYPAGPICD